MTWGFVGHRGSAQNKTSASTIVVYPGATIPVGRVLVVRVVSDNNYTSSGETDTHRTVTDAKGNQYVKLREQTYSAGAANDGVCASLWASAIATELLTTDAITVTFNAAITAKAVALEEFSKTLNSFGVLGQNAASFAGTTTPSVTLSGVVNKEALWLGHVGIEGPNEDTFIQDSDYANNTSVGTTGGAAASNVSTRFGSRVQTATSDTYNPTLGSSRDTVIMLVAIAEAKTFGKTAVGASNISRVPDYVIACGGAGGYFSLPEDGKVVCIFIHGRGSTAADNKKTAVYAVDGSGNPIDLKGQSIEVSIVGIAALRWQAFPCDIDLTAGNYRLAWNSDAQSLYCSYDAGDANAEKYKASTYPNFPNPFGTPDGTANREYSIYAAYIPAGAPPPPAAVILVQVI